MITQEEPIFSFREIVVLDLDVNYQKKTLVTIIDIHNKDVVTVSDGENTWDVLTYRLSKL